jgi:glycosyltransferase involved in cell wall biosynthesis
MQKTPLKVMIVTGLTHYGRGGVQCETEKLLIGLNEQGVDIMMLSDTSFESTKHIKSRQITCPPNRQTFCEIETIAKNYQPDIIHMIGGGNRMIAAVNKLGEQFKCIITIHNVPPYERSAPLLYGHNSLHYFIRDLLAIPSRLSWSALLHRSKFPKIICHSTQVSEYVNKIGYPLSKIDVIPFGTERVESDASASGPNSAFTKDAFPRLLSIAGYNHTKGFHDYLRVVQHLIKDFPQLHYCIIGGDRDPKYCQFIQERVRKLNLEKHVSVIRNATDEHRDAALSEADIYIQPSHEEGFCLAYLEAAMVVPLILGTTTGAISAITGTDKTGLVVAPKDINALEKASLNLISQLENIDKYKIVEERTQRLLNEFSWDNYINMHIKLYQDVTNSGKCVNES